MVGPQLEIPKPQEKEANATDRQKAYIQALSAEVGASIPSATFDALGIRQASSVIEQLQELRDQLQADASEAKSHRDWSRTTDRDSDASSSGSKVHFIVVLVAIAAVIALVYMIVK